MLGAPGGSVHRLLRVLTWLLRPRSWWSQGAGVRPAVSLHVKDVRLKSLSRLFLEPLSTYEKQVQTESPDPERTRFPLKV